MHRPPPDGHEVAALLRAGEPAALAVTAGGLAVACGTGTATVACDPAQAAALLTRWDADAGPRWVWWSAAQALGPLLAAAPPPRVRRCWDLAAVHRLLVGGSADDPGRVWAACHGLAVEDLPRAGELDLRGAAAPGADGGAAHDDALTADGHLSPEWVDGGWSTSPDRAARWAALALQAHHLQVAALEQVPGTDWVAPHHGRLVHTAWSESAAAVLALELAREGLPVDRQAAERVVASFAGPRPRDERHELRLRAARDAVVLDRAGGRPADLRSPAQVRQLLADVGLDVPDTRSWRLERLRTAHPVVEALLAWRQAERFATTYGYRWLDTHLDPDGRLRGTWSASDGGAGRMTAQAGLHSLPRELRVAVRAEPGHRIVRADLGQVEPRVLAAVSGDRALVAAAREDDLYAPVAQRLDCERSVAKVAVLAAMYGQTSGAAGQALQGMRTTYPTAMAMLETADERGRAGEHLRTYGGRLVRPWPVDDVPPEAGEAASRGYRAALAARGRFTRNAVVQGAAAELFKAWAATVRHRLAGSGSGAVVLCLHDELLLHVRDDAAEEVAEGLVADLEATAARWCPLVPVRFVADVAVVRSWSEAKADGQPTAPGPPPPTAAQR
ncbi:DNA polymerase [Thalassiella azotivora]